MEVKTNWRSDPAIETGFQPRSWLLQQRRRDLQDPRALHATLIQHRLRQRDHKIHRETSRDLMASGHEGPIVIRRPGLVRFLAIIAEELDLIERGVIADGQLDEGLLVYHDTGGVCQAPCHVQLVLDGKRVAAADYSRQLSAKVFAGACRIIGLGFKQGGIAGYGLERRLLDQYGNTRLVLALGDRKALVTDRVVLQPGQADQVATVQRVFRSFVIDGKSEYTIANELNQERILNELGRPWRMLAIRRVLTCEKYLGHYVYNKKSGKLRGPRKPNPPEDWVRFDNAFESIIDLETFRQAGQIIESRPKRSTRAWKTDAEMLSVLVVLLKKHGHLSAGIIDTSSDAPCTMTYIKRFGSLRRAYELIGFHPASFKTSDARSAATATMVKLGAELLAKIQGAAISAAFDGATGWLTIGVGLTLTILLARCQRLPAGNLRWPIRAVCKSSDLILTVRMQQDNTSVLDYYLVPKGCFPRGALTFSKYPRKPKLEAYRLETLNAVVSEIQRYQCIS